MTPIEQEDAVTDAPRKHRNDHPWAGICVAPGCTYGHSVLSREERDALARSWLTASGYAIVRSDELTRLRVALEVAADDVTTYMHRKGCWHDFESHAWQRIERWLVKRWTLRAAPEKGAPR